MFKGGNVLCLIRLTGVNIAHRSVCQSIGLGDGMGRWRIESTSSHLICCLMNRPSVRFSMATAGWSARCGIGDDLLGTHDQSGAPCTGSLNLDCTMKQGLLRRQSGIRCTSRLATAPPPVQILAMNCHSYCIHKSRP